MRQLEEAQGEQDGARVRLGPVTPEDVQEALRVTKPAQRVNDERYHKWEAEYGSV